MAPLRASVVLLYCPAFHPSSSGDPIAVAVGIVPPHHRGYSSSGPCLVEMVSFVLLYSRTAIIGLRCISCQVEVPQKSNKESPARGGGRRMPRTLPVRTRWLGPW